LNRAACAGAGTTKSGIGTDIEEVARFTKIAMNKRLLLRTFSKNEIEYCRGKGSPERHFAGLFAAKEAAYKALQQLDPVEVSPPALEVLHRPSGLPYLRIGSPALRRRVVVSISISHTSSYAVAVALASETAETGTNDLA